MSLVTILVKNSIICHKNANKVTHTKIKSTWVSHYVFKVSAELVKENDLLILGIVQSQNLLFEIS